MTPQQAVEIEQLADELSLSDGSLLLLAREVSHDATLVHFGQLTRRDCEELVFRLEEAKLDRERLRLRQQHERALRALAISGQAFDRATDSIKNLAASVAVLDGEYTR